MNTEEAKKNKVFFFEDFSSKDLNENKIGRKGYSLFRLKDMDVPVPEFFVISSDVFTKFCLESLSSNQERLLSKGRNPEREEIENNPEEEIEELVLIYQSRGLSEDTARSMAERLLGNPDTALDTLSREELGIDPNSIAEIKQLKALAQQLDKAIIDADSTLAKYNG